MLSGRVPLRIALLYPPPWKISRPGEAPPPSGEGPPADHAEGDLDSDFYQTPYGLFSLGAQAIRAGHSAKVLNLSGFAWSRVEEVIGALDADVYGLSCWTANRRGVGYVARLVKQLRPKATVVVGGPHATPLAGEMLTHHPEIDLVTVGESEETLREIVHRLESRQSLEGIAGSVFRSAGQPVYGPKRPAIANLDLLESPHRHFDTHIVMTSRGCPWQCTFCGAETSWGRGYRSQSIPYVVDALASALERLPVKMIQIKDDTFTANQKRVRQLCQAIRARGLSFLWSCDTRVDVLSEDLLREMRLAGCQRLSLGVESGSQAVLDAIQKKISVQEIVEAAAMAKKVGIRVRFYMMLGNRGETAETFRETLAFLERAAPHDVGPVALRGVAVDPAVGLDQPQVGGRRRELREGPLAVEPAAHLEHVGDRGLRGEAPREDHARGVVSVARAGAVPEVAVVVRPPPHQPVEGLERRGLRGVRDGREGRAHRTASAPREPAGDHHGVAGALFEG